MYFRFFEELLVHKIPVKLPQKQFGGAIRPELCTIVDGPGPCGNDKKEPEPTLQKGFSVPKFKRFYQRATDDIPGPGKYNKKSSFDLSESQKKWKQLIKNNKERRRRRKKKLKKTESMEALVRSGL